jgi:hypothetical protein
MSDDGATSWTPTDDPLVEAEIDRALAKYRDLVSPERYAAMRDALADVLTMHPLASRMVHRLRPPPVVDQSGTVGGAEGETAGEKTGSGR